MFKNKKAAGEAVSAMIMFIAVVGVSTGLVIAFKNFALETQDSLTYQNDLTVSKLKTSLSITHIYYNESGNQITIYVKNVGETKLRPTRFDVFIDDAFYNDFTTYYANNLSRNMTTFSPQETLAIIKDITLTSGSHDVRVVTETGVSVEDSFNI